jgi:hypothetical protein
MWITHFEAPRQALKEAPMRYSMDDEPSLFLKPGPGRKLKLELELLLVMIAQWKVFFYYMFCRPYTKIA